MADFTWLQEQSPYIQTLCGTLFTWGLTALGASLIYILPLKSANTNKLLDASLGFAAGVMLAASYWSLLSPALEKAEESLVENLSQTEANVEDLSFNNKLRIVSPVAIGFALGAAFVCIAGKYSSELSIVDFVLSGDHWLCGCVSRVFHLVSCNFAYHLSCVKKSRRSCRLSFS